MDIIVAHEGKQHSFRTAEALLQKGYLFKYITTIYDKPFSLTRIVKYLLRGDAKKKCASHRDEALPDDMVLQGVYISATMCNIVWYQSKRNNI